MKNSQEIIIAIKSGDFDHFNDAKVKRAIKELNELLGCDSYDLKEFLIILLDLMEYEDEEDE